MRLSPGRPGRPGGAAKSEALGLFAALAGPGYSRRAAILSMGQEPRWHRFLAARVGAGPGDRVLDVATGTGAVAAELALRTGCRVTGLDQSEPMLAAARERVRALGLEGRVELVRGEAEALPFEDAAFDGLTVSYLLRYVEDPTAVLRELARVVRPGGTLASLEFAIPPFPPARAAWRLYTGIALPAAGRLVGGREWADTGRFLHRGIPAFYARHPLPRLLELYAAAGLRSIRLRRLSLGGAVVIWGRRAGGG